MWEHGRRSRNVGVFSTSGNPTKEQRLGGKQTDEYIFEVAVDSCNIGTSYQVLPKL